MRNAAVEEAKENTARGAIAILADLILYMAGLSLVVAGAVMGFGNPIAEVIAGLGLIALSEWHDYRSEKT